MKISKMILATTLIACTFSQMAFAQFQIGGAGGVDFGNGMRYGGIGGIPLDSQSSNESHSTEPRQIVVLKITRSEQGLNLEKCNAVNKEILGCEFFASISETAAQDLAQRIQEGRTLDPEDKLVISIFGLTGALVGAPFGMLSATLAATEGAFIRRTFAGAAILGGILAGTTYYFVNNWSAEVVEKLVLALDRTIKSKIEVGETVVLNAPDYFWVAAAELAAQKDRPKVSGK